MSTARCATCGRARIFNLTLTTTAGQRIRVDMEGYEDETVALNAAISLLRNRKKNLENRASEEDPRWMTRRSGPRIAP